MMLANPVDYTNAGREPRPPNTYHRSSATGLSTISAQSMSNQSHATASLSISVDATLPSGHDSAYMPRLNPSPLNSSRQLSATRGAYRDIETHSTSADPYHYHANHHAQSMTSGFPTVEIENNAANILMSIYERKCRIIQEEMEEAATIIMSMYNQAVLEGWGWRDSIPPAITSKDPAVTSTDPAITSTDDEPVSPQHKAQRVISRRAIQGPSSTSPRKKSDRGKPESASGCTAEEVLEITRSTPKPVPFQNSSRRCQAALARRGPLPPSMVHGPSTLRLSHSPEAMMEEDEPLTKEDMEVAGDRAAASAALSSRSERNASETVGTLHENRTTPSPTRTSSSSTRKAKNRKSRQTAQTPTPTSASSSSSLRSATASNSNAVDKGKSKAPCKAPAPRACSSRKGKSRQMPIDTNNENEMPSSLGGLSSSSSSSSSIVKPLTPSSPRRSKRKLEDIDFDFGDDDTAPSPQKPRRTLRSSP